MHTFTPTQAAEIASGVYLLQNDSVSTVHEFGGRLGCEDMFAVSDQSRFTGKSGVLAWKPLSGFGYIAAGTGAYANEVLLATRGTAMMADWLTDATIAVQRGPSGLPVHAGFNQVWKSYVPALREFLRGRNPSRIHCVGHSLGGALAALNADFLTHERVAEVCLYTFGAPRSGDGLFAHSLTQRMGPRIYRVSNPVDPVPMIPLFPFWHLPFGEAGLQIPSTSNLPISFDGHKMKVSYIPGVAGLGWNDLKPLGLLDSLQVKSWLEQAASGHGSLLKGSAQVLAMIGRALSWLLAAAGKLVMGGVGLSLATGATVLDQVAWLLSRSAQLSKEIGLQLKGLIAAIFSFLGRKAVALADVTVAFLRWLLELLFSSLRAIAERALSSLF